MISQLDCYPCFVRQALHAARVATADEPTQQLVLRQVAALMAVFPPAAAPIEMGRDIHRIIRELTRTVDPYAAVKAASNARALALYPRLRAYVQHAPDPLLAAARVAAIGNVIDFGAHPEFDLDRAIEEGLGAELAGAGFTNFAERVPAVRSILYIGDNAGEIVFDGILVEQLRERGLRVTFVVRPGPILNDATLEDALATGMHAVADVISGGDLSPGLLLSHCDPAFRERFRSAELVLAKGQGNYEGLADERGPVFFLLKVKCAVIARQLGTGLGDLVMVAGAQQSGGEQPRPWRRSPATPG